MKHKQIEFNAEELVKCIESFAAHIQGRRKLTLRTRRLSLPPPIMPLRAKEIVASRLQLKVSHMRGVG